MCLCQTQLVINTEFVRCVICVIMVQLETAGGNNSAPFVHPETLLQCAIFAMARCVSRASFPYFNQNWKNSVKRESSVVGVRRWAGMELGYCYSP